MTDAVLVTGAFGLVGTATVKHLAAQGRHVVATDWMDTATAQAVLKHQHHSWPQMLVEISHEAGWKRYPLRLVAPLAREFLKRRSAYYRQPGTYADPWGAVRRKWGSVQEDRGSV